MRTKKSTRTRKAPAKSSGDGCVVLTTRVTEDLAPLRIGERIKVLATTTGLSEGAILRGLLMVALPQMEKDPGLIAKAPALCRAEGAAA